MQIAETTARLEGLEASHKTCSEALASNPTNDYAFFNSHSVPQIAETTERLEGLEASHKACSEALAAKEKEHKEVLHANRKAANQRASLEAQLLKVEERINEVRWATDYGQHVC